jgi:hypothetical protein
MTFFKIFVAIAAAVVAFPIGLYGGGFLGNCACKLARPSATGGPELLMMFLCAATGALALPVATFGYILIYI